jgi:ankyrin repeat protein
MLRENTLYREEIEELHEIFFIDDHDKDGYTPLILAAGTRILLTHSLTYLLTYSLTHVHIGYNMVDVVIELIEQDVKLDDTNKFGHTALTWACAGTHSLTYSLTYLLTYSLTYLLTHSLTHYRRSY